MARSCRKWPELSPLVHNRCLVRLKKVTWPLVNVCCKASSLTKPCIRTTPVKTCWTITGIRPSTLAQSRLLASNCTELVTDLHSLVTQISLKFRDRDDALVEYRGGQRPIHIRLLECIEEMNHLAGSARGDERHAAQAADQPELLQIIPLAHAILVHHVE